MDKIKNHKLNNYLSGDLWYIGFAESHELISQEIRGKKNFRYWEITNYFELDNKMKLNVVIGRIDLSKIIFVYSE